MALVDGRDDWLDRLEMGLMEGMVCLYDDWRDVRRRRLVRCSMLVRCSYDDDDLYDARCLYDDDDTMFVDVSITGDRTTQPAIGCGWLRAHTRDVRQTAQAMGQRRRQVALPSQAVELRDTTS